MSQCAKTLFEKVWESHVVVAPEADFTDFAPKVSGSVAPLGRIPFAIVVKVGGPHPDISTHEKFVSFVRGAWEEQALAL